jgi:hypothetical protein
MQRMPPEPTTDDTPALAGKTNLPAPILGVPATKCEGLRPGSAEERYKELLNNSPGPMVRDGGQAIKVSSREERQEVLFRL